MSIQNVGCRQGQRPHPTHLQATSILETYYENLTAVHQCRRVRLVHEPHQCPEKGRNEQHLGERGQLAS